MTVSKLVRSSPGILKPTKYDFLILNCVKIRSVFSICNVAKCLMTKSVTYSYSPVFTLMVTIARNIGNIAKRTHRLLKLFV